MVKFTQPLASGADYRQLYFGIVFKCGIYASKPLRHASFGMAYDKLQTGHA